MMPAVACGTIRTARATTPRMSTAATIATISPATGTSLGGFQREYDGGRAVDFDHVDRCADRDRDPVGVRAGRQHFAADPYLPAGRVDGDDHRPAAADESRGTGTQAGREVAMPASDRANYAEE